ncbi:MAG: RNA-guided endonuclease InsQ/TnpB family protein [Candidatus Njordarchaeales archaeon]
MQTALQRRKILFKRTIVIKLKPMANQEAFLREWSENCAVLWNMINYKRRREFFEKGRVDLSEDKDLYNAFKHLAGSATAQQIMRKNSEAWKSFLTLKKKLREGKLPKNIGRVSPPRYWKDRATGTRNGIIIVRRDLYSLSSKHLFIRAAPRALLKKFGLKSPVKIRWSGRPLWSGKFGRLEIVYDVVSGKWYAHISVEVVKYVDDPSHQPNFASIDLGVKNLAAVYYSSGDAEVYKGSTFLADFFHLKRVLSAYQSALNKSGFKISKRLKRIFRRYKRRFRHAVKAMVKDILEKARSRGVGVIYIGYPKHIRDRVNGGWRSNSLVHNFWSFKFILDWFRVKAVEYGVKIVFAGEAYTSITCPKCGYSSPSNRKHRGLFKCVKCGFVANADLVGAFNIAKLNGGGSTLKSHERLSFPTPLIWDRHKWKPYRRNDNPESSPRGVGRIGVTGFGHPEAPPFIGAQRIPPIHWGE